MAELYRFELKKCLQQKVLWITGGILLLCLCLWGAAACLQTTDSGLRGEEIIRLHREGGAALAVRPWTRICWTNFGRPMKNGFCRGRPGS